MASLLIAEMAQNNPYCQKQLIEADILPKLMSLLSDDKDDVTVDVLRAVSCIVRGYPPAFEAFTEIGGLECLLGFLQQSKEEKLILRAVFLMNSLCSEYSIQDQLIKFGAIEMITPLIKVESEYNVCLETLLSTLCSLTQCDLASSHHFKHEFMKTLQDIVKISKDKPECREIAEYSEALLKNNFDLKADFEIADK